MPTMPSVVPTPTGHEGDRRRADAHSTRCPMPTGGRIDPHRHPPRRSEAEPTPAPDTPADHAHAHARRSTSPGPRQARPPRARARAPLVESSGEYLPAHTTGHHSYGYGMGAGKGAGGEGPGPNSGPESRGPDKVKERGGAVIWPGL
jgi:hypothetical protein